MKRSVRQALSSQEGSSKMSRRDLEAVKKTETPTTNIFLVETVLRRLFKQIKSVSMLKDLRKICQLWDRLDTEELEERAFQGLFKPINLTFSNEVSREFKPIKDSRLEIREFFDDTSSNPRLFRSFTIAFPHSLAILNLYKFRWFYKDYSPTFLELAISYDLRFNKDKEWLFKVLLRWASPTLRQLVIRNNFAAELNQIPTRKSLEVQPFNFPHLWKMSTQIYNYGSNGIIEAFRSIFTKENHPETPSLTSLRLLYEYLFDILDINSNPSRWATLTNLDILYEADNGTNRFSEGLLSLARAGMALKKLELGLCLVVDPHFLETCCKLSKFFASQARSLEALKLSFNLNLSVTIDEDQMEQIKILLPVFDRLHTLSLDLDTLVYTINDNFTRNIIEFGSISHFPALENLTIHKFGGSNPFWGVSCEEVERINLKRHSSNLFWVDI